MSRQNPINELRERYHRSRSHSLSSTDLPTTVFEEEEEEEEEEDDDDSYSMDSCASSIPDENINFDLVYALHTFVATVDGQASVIKGDAMTLLDDTNSYWWLIRELKASEIGYIPAENIETPFERLARLNKHRNVQVTVDVPETTPAAAVKKKKKVQLSTSLACQLQVILTDENDNTLYEETYEEWDEKMSCFALMEEEINSSLKKKKAEQQSEKKKFTPIMNPDFNKPIQIEPALDQDTHVTKALPLLPPSLPKEEEINTIVPESLPPPPPPVHQEQQQPRVTGLRRFLSIGSRDTKKNSTLNTTEKVIKPLARSSSLQHHHQQQQQQKSPEQPDKQYHVLRIFSGNINVGALFNTVAVTPDMNADQLLKLALQKFHIPLLEDQENNTRSQHGIEYYLTVKSMDGDEVTLEPKDKPLAIFESLSDHLTTPMPSLTYMKRLSMEQPTIKVTRVGVSKARQRAKARFGEDSVIRFSLHKRIKRTINTDAGQIYVKISYYAEPKKRKVSPMGLIRKSSLLRLDQQAQQSQQKAKMERIDKLVAVTTVTSIFDLTRIALEKFHMEELERSLYYMALSLNGKETPLKSSKTISDILNDSLPGKSVEQLFVLRKRADIAPPIIPMTSVSESTSESTNRFVRYMMKGQDKEVIQQAPLQTNTGHVLKRLDEAILSLEKDKRQLDTFQYNNVKRNVFLSRKLTQ